MFTPPCDAREQFRRVTERGFDAAAAALLREHAALAEAERETMRILNNRCVPGRASLTPAPRVPSEAGLQSPLCGNVRMRCRGCMACALGHDGDCILSITLYLLRPKHARIGYAVPADCILSCLPIFVCTSGRKRRTPCVRNQASASCGVVCPIQNASRDN